MSAATPEPPPEPGKVDIWLLVLEDIKARVEAGKEKYGTVLQSHNGRDALMDAYQENIDMLLYQRQALQEIDDLKAEILQLRSESMSLKNDAWIKKMCEGDNPLISPFIPHQIGDGVISYGLGGHGYDIRVADEFEIFTNVGNGAKVVDPKKFDPELLHRYQGPVCTIPPNSFALARSIEYFKLPIWVVGICLCKSTYARVGIIINFTPLEAGWEGHLTIEISNTSPLPALIYANEGIAQVLFFESDPAGVGYGDREGGGKYQGQMGITKARV